jgi:hypothetical protein
MVKRVMDGLDDAGVREVYSHVVALAVSRGVSVGSLCPSTPSPVAATGVPVFTTMARNRRSSWTKRVHGVNWKARGGYAINGEFLDSGGTLKFGDMIVACRIVGGQKKYALLMCDASPTGATWEDQDYAGCRLLASTGCPGTTPLPAGVKAPTGFGAMQEVAVELMARGM